MKQGELNTYADAGTPEDDPYTEPCPRCKGCGIGGVREDGEETPCRTCDGAGVVERERPAKEDFAPEDEDD